jgi:hypothetical protein
MVIFRSSGIAGKGTKSEGGSGFSQGTKESDTRKDPATNPVFMTSEDRHYKMYLEEKILQQTRYL